MRDYMVTMPDERHYRMTADSLEDVQNAVFRTHAGDTSYAAWAPRGEDFWLFAPVEPCGSLRLRTPEGVVTIQAVH